MFAADIDCVNNLLFFISFIQKLAHAIELCLFRLFSTFDLACFVGVFLHEHIQFNFIDFCFFIFAMASNHLLVWFYQQFPVSKSDNKIYCCPNIIIIFHSPFLIFQAVVLFFYSFLCLFYPFSIDRLRLQLTCRTQRIQSIRSDIYLHFSCYSSLCFSFVCLHIVCFCVDKFASQMYASWLEYTGFRFSPTSFSTFNTLFSCLSVPIFVFCTLSFDTISFCLLNFRWFFFNCFPL